MKKGDCVSINGITYHLGEFLGQGAEGEVFRLVEEPREIVKILRLSKDESVNIKKRRALNRLARLENISLNTRLILPRKLLDPPNIGYQMSYYPDSLKLSSYLEEPSDLATFKQILASPQHNFMKRMKIAALLFKSMYFIHQEGLTFCDVSPGNILVKNDDIGIAFIDTDNLVVNNLFSPNISGTLRYMAPEVVNSIKEATRHSDVYSMAIIAFELLTFRHPFIGDDILEAEVEEEHKAFQGLKDYVLAENSENLIHASQFKQLVEVYFTPTLRSLFLTTFTAGKHTFLNRPTAEQFSTAFYQAVDHMDLCDNIDCHFPYDKLRFTLCPLCNQKRGPIAVFRVTFDVFDDEALTARSVVSEQIIKPNVDNLIYERHIKVDAIGNSRKVGKLNYSSESLKGIYQIIKGSEKVSLKLLDTHTGKLYELTKSAYEFNIFDHAIIYDETVATLNGKVRTMRVIGKAYKVDNVCS